MTESLEAILVARIRERGPMPFAAFMQLALYHPTHGYYRSGARTGRVGHFMTSPELDPAFGALWARGFERVWMAAGKPDEFHVVEIGPGEGGLTRAVLSTTGGRFGDALRFALVERGRSNRERQEGSLADDPRVTWHASLAEVPPVVHGCVFANEVLDNLPVHLVERREGRLLEVCVSEEEGRLVETLLPPSSPELGSFVDRAGLHLADGHRCEVTLAAESLVAHAGRVIEQGAVIFVDYGLEGRDHLERPRGTLVAYSQEGADENVLARPGERDITAHANWTAVRVALQRARFDVSGPLTQRQVLLDIGAAHLEAHLRSEHEGAIARGEGALAVRALSRRQALAALLDPGGLGGLQVMVGGRGIPGDVLERDEDRR